MPKLTKRRPTLKRTSRTNLEVCKSLLKGKKPDGLSPELFHALLDHGGLQLLPTGQAVPQPPPKMAPTANVFCATGPGGGVDPTCSPGELGAGRRRKIDPNQKEIFPPDWDKPKPEEHIPPPQDDEIKLEQPVHDHAKIESLCKELAGLWGYKGNLKVDNGEPPTFEVNGVKYTEGGHCKLASKEIVMWSRQYREEGGDRRAHTVMTHELMHGTYETVIENYRREHSALIARPDAYSHRADGKLVPGIFNVDGSINNEYLKKYPDIKKQTPTYFRLRQFEDNYQMRQELIKHDGVTDYSRNYWAEFGRGQRTYHIAAHETLAEIAAGRMGAVKPKGWTEPHQHWENYYKAVQDEYQVIVGNRDKRQKTHKYDVITNRADLSHVQPMFLDDDFAPTSEEQATWVKLWVDGRAVYAQRMVLTTNTFCPTGEGGGIDPTCSPKASGEPRVILDSANKFLSEFSGPSGEKYSVEAEKYEGKWSVSFLLDRGPDDKTMKLTGSAGAAAVGIMRAVGRAIDKFVELKRPEEFYFDAVKNEPSRVRMYATASQSIAKRHGYELTTEDKPDFVVYRFRKQGPANNSRLTANWQVLPNSYLTTHGIMSWFKSCPRDEEGRCGEGGGGSKEPGSDTSGAYMAGVDRQFKNPQESETLKAIVKGEPPHDKHDLHYGLASSKEDTALTAIMKEAGRADVPRSASKEEIDGLVKQGWTECYRGLGNKEYAEQFKKSPDMYNGAGSFGNGSYFTYGGNARSSDKAKKGAEMYAAINDPKGEGGSVVRMAFPKDAKIIDHKDLMKEKDKAVAELFDRHSKGEITKEERDKTREVYEDLGRFGALRNYDGIKERENGFLVVLNRSKCVVQRD